MAEPTFRPSLEDQMLRLSRSAEEIRASLALAEARLDRTGHHLPQGVLEGLRQMSGTLLVIQSTMESREAERRGLRALAGVGQVINSSLELPVVLAEVIDTMIRLTRAQRVFIMLKGESDVMKTVAARNWERETLDDVEIEFSKTIVDRVLSSGEPILTTNAQSDPRFGGNESIIAYNLTSILCVPLKAKGKLIGVIYADNKVKEALFSERERELLMAFSNQAAIALENARLFESVKQSLAEVTDLKNFMDDVFASMSNGVITLDLDDRITMANRAAERILGRNNSQLVGTRLDTTLPDVHGDLQSHLTGVRQRGQHVKGLEVTTDLPEDHRAVTLTVSMAPLVGSEEGTRGVTVVLDDVTERRRLEAQRRLFERMVSPAVIEQLDPDGLKLGGQVREITTLFADIRGFTAFSESLAPEDLVEILNRYLASAATAVLNHGGTIDKFMGDAVMAWFNAPLAQEDHARRAVEAALQLRDATTRLHHEVTTDLRLSFGIGIHTGEALLGLVGSERRLDYTAIGDSVNTAKRIQESAEHGQILISGSTLKQLGSAVQVRPIEGMSLKGKLDPIAIFEVLGLA